MAQKEGNGFFSIFGSIFTWVKWIVVLLIVILLFILGVKLYPILKDCWTCNILSGIYNTFSILGAKTFEYFQENVMVLISVCLALWIVHQTYIALKPSLTFLAPSEPKFNADFIKNIYKKIFLTVAVIGLVILNNPRNVFSNTFEITLDFGTNISREFLRKKIIDKSKIPPECVETSKELSYSNGGVLSDNTRDDMVCLLKEVNLLRHDYMDIGIALVEHSKPGLIYLFAKTVFIKAATSLGGRAIAKKFSPKHLAKQKKKLAKLGKNSENAEKNKQAIERLEKSIKDIENDAKNGGKKAKSYKFWGKTLSKSSNTIALASAIFDFFLFEDVRMGLAGIGLVMGLFIINMFFAFIIIEKILFLGISILLLPLLAACYIFEQTRNFATTALKDTFSFAIGLIFMSITMVMCAEINDWILGGMFSAPDADNVTQTAKAIALIKAGKIDEFNDLVGSNWYFIYVIFVIGVNALLIKSAGTFASWFNGSISDSDLVKPLWDIGTSTYKTTKSVVREIKLFADKGEMSGKDTGRFIDRFISDKWQSRLDKKKEKSKQKETMKDEQE